MPMATKSTIYLSKDLTIMLSEQRHVGISARVTFASMTRDLANSIDDIKSLNEDLQRKKYVVTIFLTNSHGTS